VLAAKWARTVAGNGQTVRNLADHHSILISTGATNVADVRPIRRGLNTFYTPALGIDEGALENRFVSEEPPDVPWGLRYHGSSHTIRRDTSAGESDFAEFYVAVLSNLNCVAI
jgi:hypothetical protein